MEQRTRYGKICWHIMVTAALLACVTACSRREGKGNGRTVAVSIEPLRHFTEQLAAEHFEVETVVPKGYSPETYEPTPQQMMSIANASAYLKIGDLGFETTWLAKMLGNAPHLKVFSATDSLQYGQGGLTVSNFDRHVWTSPGNVLLMGRAICAMLCQTDPDNAPGYEQRLKEWSAGIAQLEKRIRKMLENVEVRTFVTVHPTLGHFAAEYGFRQLSIEKDGKEPTPQDLRSLITQCRQEKVKVVFCQPEFSRKFADLVAKQTGAKVVEINPLSYQWEKEMLTIAKALSDEQ